jgi:HTH-type transcriptional regulator/antitoxin HipB
MRQTTIPTTSLPMRQPITTPAQVGQILRARRAARRISQRTLAEKLGITQGRFSMLEADPAALTVGRLLALANALGLTLVVQDKSDQLAPETEW